MDNELSIYEIGSRLAQEIYEKEGDDYYCLEEWLKKGYQDEDNPLDHMLMLIQNTAVYEQITKNEFAIFCSAIDGDGERYYLVNHATAYHLRQISIVKSHYYQTIAPVIEMVAGDLFKIQQYFMEQEKREERK